MSQLKGILGAIPITIVIVFGILMFMLVTLTLQTLEQKVKVKIEVGLEADAMGSLYSSLLASEKGDIGSMEKAGADTIAKTVEKAGKHEGRQYRVSIYPRQKPRPPNSVDVPLQGGGFAVLQIAGLA